ncbi:hypothetical protein Esti_004288 [Eimeria stiedai]
MEVSAPKPEEASAQAVAAQEEGEAGDEEREEGHDVASSSHHLELPANLPDPSKRRRSQVVSADQAGCYLLYDQHQAKWVALWSPAYVAEAVAILTPHVKVPAFKYNKKEKVVLEGEKSAPKDVKRDYLAGLCGFFKIVRDFKGDLTLLPSAEELELKEMVLIGLHGKELKRFDKFDFTYPYAELDCVALVPKKEVNLRVKTLSTYSFTMEWIKDKCRVEGEGKPSSSFLRIKGGFPHRQRMSRALKEGQDHH